MLFAARYAYRGLDHHEAVPQAKIRSRQDTQFVDTSVNFRPAFIFSIFYQLNTSSKMTPLSTQPAYSYAPHGIQ
jgi:hypothetical protein